MVTSRDPGLFWGLALNVFVYGGTHVILATSYPRLHSWTVGLCCECGLLSNASRSLEPKLRSVFGQFWVQLFATVETSNRDFQHPISTERLGSCADAPHIHSGSAKPFQIC